MASPEKSVTLKLIYNLQAIVILSQIAKLLNLNDHGQLYLLILAKKYILIEM